MIRAVPDIGEQLQCRSRATWRKWLERHHAAKSEIWLVLYKKHVRKPWVSYEDAVEEALCFGWIDGILKRLDDERHVLRFSPRRPNSVWSDPNKQRVRRLLREGQMTEPGLAAVRAGKRSGKWQRGSGKQLTDVVPADLEAALKRNRKAHAGFGKLAPSQRRQYVGWILEAKRDETRRRRIRETVQRVARGKRPGVD